MINTIGIIIGIIIMIAMVVMIIICLVIMYKDIQEDSIPPYSHYQEILQMNTDLQNRIYKAIMFVEKVNVQDDKNYEKDLIDILRGKDE